MSEAQVKKRRQEKEARLPIVARLYKQGHSLRSICRAVVEELGLSGLAVNTIKNDVNTLLCEWRGERLADMDKYVTLELQKLDAMESELWSEWLRSKETRKEIRINADDGKTKIAKEGLGDVQYMALLLKIQERRAKLLGYDAPQRVELGGGMSLRHETAVTVDVEKIPEAELLRLATELQDAVEVE